MNPERWEKVNELFHAAVGRGAAERAAFLAEACAGDAALLGEVERLVAAHQRAGGFIETPAVDKAFQLLTGRGGQPVAGSRLGVYKIVRELGRGGMGAVYLAERADEQFEKYVAVKLIKRGMDTEAVVRHFRNERQILASLDHPNIARLLDGGTTDDGLPYFVMEYVAGVPIDRHCDSRGLSVTERLDLFREVCAAVAYAHRHLVIHRDIKPSNILITGEGVPKLLDFGIAKILQPGGEAATATGLRLMTPEYASPEQAQGLRVTTLTDVYSLGVVLYELLTGRAPYSFDSRTPHDIARAISETEPPRPSTVAGTSPAPATGGGGGVQPTAATAATGRARGGTPERLRRRLRGDLDNIVLKAMRKEPGRRYQSVEQFSEDIRRHLVGLPVLARKDTLRYRAAKFVRRNKAAAAAAALVFLTLLLGIAATTWQARKAGAEKARAERRFNDVRKLANALLFDYHDAVQHLPGSTPVRERLVKDALAYLDGLAAESGDDPALQRELAAAYDRLGDVAGGSLNANLGDMAGAMESYEKALRIREALVAADGRDPQNRRDLAGSYKRVGNQLLSTSEASRGAELLRRALALRLELVAERPNDPAARDELAVGYSDLGSAFEDQGDMAGALEHHRRSLALREELMAADPRNRKQRRSLSVVHENIGRALFLSDDAEGALESNGKALALREALLAEDPTNADYRRILGVSYQNNGDYRAWRKDIRGALESFRRKLSIDEESLAADPVNAQARGDLGYTSQRMGDLLAELGDHVQALPHYRRAIEMVEKNAAGAPDDLNSRISLATIRATSGRSHAKLGNSAPAREECRKAAELLRETFDDPAHAAQRRVRALAYTYLGEAYATLAAVSGASPGAAAEHWRAARDMYRRGLDIMRELRDRGVLDSEEVLELDAVARKIAECDAALGRALAR